MIGITAYGAYIPYNRMDRKAIAKAFGKPVPPGEKAVANYDEDSVTMAVAAALECTKGFDVTKLSNLYFASTTAPYREKQSAANVLATLDAPRTVRTADFSNSLRAGTSAMLAAADAALAGRPTLLTVSDMRLGAADGANELNFGDAAAAFLFGSDSMLAELRDSFSVGVDFHDGWRNGNDLFVRDWEERFCITQGYFPFVTAAVRGVLEKTGLQPSDFKKIVNYAPTPRYQTEIALKLGFQPEQIQDSLYSTVGNAGAANAPLMLAAALDEAQPGDKFLLVTYGEGADALVFVATDEIGNKRAARTVRGYLTQKRTTMNYEKYLRWRGLLSFETGKRPPQDRSSLPDYFRKYEKNYALHGCRCKECGTPQFPPNRVCIKCGSVDRMESYRFYGRKGKIATFTFDYLAASQDPPTVMVVVDFEGGGRMFTSLVDCDLEKVCVGMPVEMSYRKLFTVEGFNTYFWKVVPAEQQEGE